MNAAIQMPNALKANFTQMSNRWVYMIHGSMRLRGGGAMFSEYVSELLVSGPSLRSPLWSQREAGRSTARH